MKVAEVTVPVKMEIENPEVIDELRSLRDFVKEQQESTAPMSWRERRAFKRAQKEERKAERAFEKRHAKADKKLIKAAKRQARISAKIERQREKHRDLALVADFNAEALRAGTKVMTSDSAMLETLGAQFATDVLDRAAKVAREVRESNTFMRNRCFKYVALVGTWLVALAITMLVCCSCAASKPQLSATQPGLTRDGLSQFDALVEIEEWCMTVKATEGVAVGPYMSSGVAIDSTHVLTAAHTVTCIRDQKLATAVFRLTHKGTTYFANIARLDRKRDVALLELKEGSMVVAEPVRIVPPKVGDGVCAVTAQPEVRSKCGVIKKLTPTEIYTDLPIRGGNSGSALYNTRGQLVGIVRAVVWCTQLDELWSKSETFAPFAESCAGVAARIAPEVLP